MDLELTANVKRNFTESWNRETGKLGNQPVDCCRVSRQLSTLISASSKVIVLAKRFPEP